MTSRSLPCPRLSTPMGSGFSFVARQKRMVIDGEDHTLTCSFITGGSVALWPWN